MSTHINAAERGDIAERVLMPGDPLRAKRIAEEFLADAVCYSNVRNMYGFTGKYNGIPVSVQGSGMGMPSMGIYSWELMKEYGVKKLIRVGTAGSFSANISPGDVVLALSASTDSNYQHTFDVPGHYAPCASFDLIKKALQANEDVGLKINAGNVISSDVFYEINKDWWKKWADMGVMAVEMEAAALYMNAAYLGAEALAMMTITDHFISGESYTSEERESANAEMTRLALETIIR